MDNNIEKILMDLMQQVAELRQVVESKTVEQKPILEKNLKKISKKDQERRMYSQFAFTLPDNLLRQAYINVLKKKGLWLI